MIRAAAAHLDAARELLHACPAGKGSTRGHEVVYLCGYTVECSLKALLLSRYPAKTHPDHLVRFKEQIKHNLEMLRNELMEKGVNFAKDQNESLRHIRRKWSSEMRYEVTHWSRDDAEQVVLAAEKIFDWIKGG